ncbi:hypothetical protein C1H46_023316 [Malus baccata]|uniref:Uncharacterized protein n=1 Tax=Malus baccata TaxID=106549 RepID=A0A540LXU1_MALBA|nr:hypothetical protein C1H46_023316 [Malus baccata]
MTAFQSTSSAHSTVKFLEQITIVTKPMIYKLNKPTRVPSKLVQIILMGANAINSSKDDKDNGLCIVKRHSKRSALSSPYFIFLSFIFIVVFFGSVKASQERPETRVLISM